ncbi:type II toxin-antitoxin system PemK/MazF family toxin [Candidatus Saccharibacteria bacterium]|nr:type II toxin-antitoxin system PemK/MazF family toxin [Candidatus Saccharibacteria bacterium]
MIKNFDKWNSVKKELNSKIDKPPTIHNGEIWWCSVGVNIECEEDGKNDFFDRPVLVFRKLAKNKFYGIPLSTQEQRFENYTHKFLYAGKNAYALLDQMRVLSTNRLRNDFVPVKISRKNYAIIKAKLSIVLGFMDSSIKIFPPS